MTGNFVIERAWQDPGEPGSVHAEVRIGGHLEMVHVLFTDPVLPLCQLHAMGLLISMHRPCERAVVNALHRVYKGDDVAFPLDLFPNLANVEPPFPYVQTSPERAARLARACEERGIVCVALRAVDDVPGLYDADLTVNGRELRVRVSVFAGAGKAPVVIWRSSEQPEELTRLSIEDRAAAEWAILHALS